MASMATQRGTGASPVQKELLLHGRGARATKGKMTRRERREAFEALLFLSPWLIGFTLFTAGPVITSFVLSFFRWDIIHPAKFIGLGNWKHLFRDPTLAESLGHTLVYSVLHIPLAMGVALGLAMLLNQKLRGMRIFRTIFYLPHLTQGVATFTLWSVVLEPETGVINRVLRLFMNHPPQWLFDPFWAKPALVLMSLWATGGMMLVFLAGLQNIPSQLYEAAEIDGAGRASQFLNVTLPMLSPTIFFNLIVSTIASLRVFDSAFILTNGGPSNSTLFYVYYLFNRAFVYFNMGYASAMAWLLFAVSLILTVVQLKLGKRWVHYG